MKQSASKMCMGSKANGSLMRITPLGIWGHNLDTSEIANYAIQDTSLSHPNNSCGYAVACYSIAIANAPAKLSAQRLAFGAIATLIREPGNRELAFYNAQKWLNAQADLAKDSYQYHC
jgi:ADP-ribosylglycohydrolase